MASGGHNTTWACNSNSDGLPRAKLWIYDQNVEKSAEGHNFEAKTSFPHPD